MKRTFTHFLMGFLLLCSAQIFATTSSETESNNLYTEANTLVPGDTITGAVLGTSLDIDWFEVVTVQDGAVNANMNLSGSGYVYYGIYDNDGTTLLAAGGIFLAGSTHNIAYPKAAAGTYYIVIYYYNSSTNVTYSLTSTVVSPAEANDDEPNGTPGTAAAMDENSSVEGHIGYRSNGGTFDTDDYYAFTTTQDGNITLSFANTTGQYHTVYLYDSDGTTQLGNNSGYGSASFTKTGLQAGDYYARINYYSTSYYSGYTLTNTVTPTEYDADAEPNNLYSEATIELFDTDSTFGHIGHRKNGGAYDTDDWYIINMSVDGQLSLSVSNSTGQYSGIYLYDADGVTSLGSNFGYSTATFTKSNLAAGTYFAKVDSYSSSFFSGYKLKSTLTPAPYASDAEPNNVYTEAIGGLIENDSVYGHIGYRNNGGNFDTEDWYQITLSNDGQISLNITYNNAMYHGIYLFDANGTTSLGSNFGYGTATFTKSNLSAGTYYAKVDNYSSSFYSGYKLKYSVVPAPYDNDPEPNNTLETASPMLTNSIVEGHIGYRNNGGTFDTEDWYEFTISSIGDVTLTIAHPVDMYHGIYIYNSAGSSLGSNFGYGTHSITKTDLAPGTYYAKVDNYSSSYYSGYQLTNYYCPDAISIIAEGETTLCEGESVILSTADHHLSYLWSDGSTTETNAAALTGEFSLTIDNGGGCVRSSNTLAVDVTPNPVAILLADGPTEFCAGGSVTLSADIDVTPDAYLWSTGETTATIEVSETGDYSLELFKGSCSAISDPIAITVNANPVATITPVGSTTFCEGGSVTLNASAGDSYLWSNGETASSIVVDASGDYSVEITNAAGCSDASAITTVTVNANPTAGISADGDTEFCEGGSVNLTASGGTSYLWNTGATTASINVTETGDYSCTVSNAAGCDDVTGIISVTVNANPVVEISADGPTTFCIGGSVNLSVDSFFDIFWSTGETTESIDVTEAGAYSVSVTDANGCSATSDAVNVVVEECGSVVITADGPTTFCAGGSVTLTSSEESGNIWSTGETTQSIVVTESGDYSCENGVNTSNTISVTVNSNPVADISADGPTTFCEGGSVNLTASGGTDYLWSTGEITATINAISDGDYSCVVTNDEGCSDVSSIVSVIVNANPVADISADGPTTFCEGGSVNLTASGGTDYLWSTGETTATINVMTTGDYSCLVSNAAGCSDVSSAISVIAEECGTEITISAEGATEFCNGESVVLTSSAVEGNIWSTGETTQSIEVSASGDYYCSNGAFTSNTISVAVVDQPSISVEPVGPDKICFEESVMLSAISSDGALQWYRNGVAIPGANGELLEITTAGLYSCSVDNGICPVANSNEVKITYFKGAEITPSGTSYVCPGGSIILSSPYSASAAYQWYRNNNPIPGAVSNTYEATIGGKYFVVITRDGCGRVSGTAKIIMDCRLTDDNELSSLIYPNPASTSVNIITDGQQGDKIEMVLCDINGRIVLQQYYVLSYTGEEIGLSLFDLANGIYNLQLRYPNGTINQHPLVINK